jgi:hypothetical protein
MSELVCLCDAETMCVYGTLAKALWNTELPPRLRVRVFEIQSSFLLKLTRLKSKIVGSLTKFNECYDLDCLILVVYKRPLLKVCSSLTASSRL